MAELKSVSGVMYDTERFPAGLPWCTANLFCTPIGAYSRTGNVIKTESDTNMYQAGCLGYPNEMDVSRITLDVLGASTEDMLCLFDNAVFSWLLGLQRPIFTYPISSMRPLHSPSVFPASLSGSKPTADSILKYVAETRLKGEEIDRGYIESIFGISRGTDGKGIETLVNGAPMHIGPGENFGASIKFPSVAMVPESDFRIRAVMHGTIHMYMYM